MKLTKAQLKQIIKEELNEINLEDLGQDRRSQHTARRGVKKGDIEREEIAVHIRNLPAWKQYTRPEYEETDYWKRAVTPDHEEQAREHEEHLMTIAGEIYKVWGRNWKDHKDVIERRIGKLAEPHSYPSFAPN